MPIDSLSLWERVGERVYRCFTRLGVFVFECHSLTPEHKSQEWIPLANPHPQPFSQGGRETIRANAFIRFLSFCSNQLLGLNRLKRFD